MEFSFSYLTHHPTHYPLTSRSFPRTVITGKCCLWQSLMLASCSCELLTNYVDFILNHVCETGVLVGGEDTLSSSYVRLITGLPTITFQTINKVTVTWSYFGQPAPLLHLQRPPTLPLCCVCSVISSSLTPHGGFPVWVLHFPVPVQSGTAY